MYSLKLYTRNFVRNCLNLIIIIAKTNLLQLLTRTKSGNARLILVQLYSDVEEFAPVECGPQNPKKR